VSRAFVAAAFLIAVLGISACGSSESDSAGSDFDEVSKVARAFARAVDPQANPRKLCKLLEGDAQRHQGCGTHGEDIGPLLQLAIDNERDVQVVEVKDGSAVTHIPSIPFRGEAKGAGPSQVLRLRKIDGEWKFTRLELCEPRGGCAYPPASERRLVLRRDPYMGVACRRPNSIACDRVGLAVWLVEPAKRLTATIAGRPVRMRSPGGFVAGRRTGWEGYLQPAGLGKEPFDVRPDADSDRWIGRRPVYVLVRLVAHYADGSSASVTRHVSLAPGWG
jgi:hypothetical protein